MFGKNKVQVLMMAAGFGSRVGEITQYIPKSLIPINGKPMIERHIEYMIEAGVSRLIMTVGYKKERFEYLVSKYKDQLEIIQVENPYYREYNTFSTIYVASDYFDRDTFFVTSDLFLTENIYLKYGWKNTDSVQYGFYLHKNEAQLPRPEWVANLGEDEKGMYITSVNTAGMAGSVWSGISFWTKSDLVFINKLLHDVDWNDPASKKLYWDELFFPYYQKWHVHVRHMENNYDIFEVDCEEDLVNLKKYVNDPVSTEELKQMLRKKYN